MSLDAFAIEVTNVNDAPTLSGTPDTKAVHDTPYSFTPVAEDVDGDTLTFSLSGQADWLSFDAETGTLSGTPTNDDVGSTEALLISVTDGVETAYLDAFTITVANTNDAPTISGTPETSVAQDRAYTFTPVAEDIDEDSLTFSISNRPGWASFDTASGTLSGTPTNDDVGTTSGIVLSVSDGAETVSLDAFAIEVTNVNDAPTLSGTPDTKAVQDTPYSFTPVAEDVDGDTLTFSLSGQADWLSFDAETGTLSGTPTNDDVGSTEALLISVTDGVETAYLDAFTITVANTNDAPTLSGTPETSVAQDRAYTFTPVAEDIDEDSLTFSISNRPGWASFDTASGTLSGTPTNDDVGTTSGIVLSVSDGAETVSLDAFAIEVTNVNDAPTLSGTPDTKAVQDTPYSFTPVAEDVDGDTLTFSLSGQADWLSFDAETGTLSGTPTNDDVGSTEALLISVTDGVETAYLDAFTITVANTNDAPTISGTPETSVAQDRAYTFTPVAEDIDEDSLTFSISNRPGWASFDTASGTLSGTPTNDDVGTTSGIVLSVSDGAETVSLDAFAIEVTNVNDAPTLSGTPDTKAVQDTPYSFTPVADDIDGDTLIFSISNAPDWASFDTATGTLAGTPGNDDVGSTSGIVLSVSDGAESVSLDAFAIEVTNVNDAPTLSGTPDTKAVQDTPYSFTPVAEDVDDDTLTFSISGQTDWLSFDAETGTLAGTPTNDDVGSTEALVISVTDGVETAYLDAFTITVTNTNDAPTISGTPDSTVAQDSTYTFTPYADDIDGDTLTFSISNAPDWASFNAATGALSGTPANDDVGTTSNIVLSVSDGTESVSLDAFAITVTNVNDAPVAVDDSFQFAVSDNGIYTLDVLANDTDADGDTLQLGWVTTDTGNASIQDSTLVLVADTTGTIVLKYSVTDSSDDYDIGQVTVVIEADTEQAPVVTAPEDVEVNATGLFTKVDLGVAVAEDSNGEALAVSMTAEDAFFAPGSHTVYWSAEDADGNVGTASQKVVVHPLISIQRDSDTTEGSTHTVSVYLNSEAPSYPVTIPYTVSGSADSADHDLVDGEVVINSGTEGEIEFSVLADDEPEGTETVEIILDSSLNLGNKSSYVLNISESNVPPEVNIAVAQGGELRSMVENNSDTVSVTATVADANQEDTHSYNWINDNAQLANISTNEHAFEFSPDGIATGIYHLELEVSDGTDTVSQ